MKRAVISLAAMAVLAVAGCSQTMPGGASGNGAAGADGFGAGAGSLSPSSPAYFQQTVGDRVLFAVDESTLSDSARATLAQQARWLMQNGEYGATIEGHADEQGTREYNLALGARRASAVQEFLVVQGVAPSRLEIVTYGKERPLEICSEESCYAKNRRAVTVLATGAGT